MIPIMLNGAPHQVPPHHTLDQLIAALSLQGQALALVSDAGTPLISDGAGRQPLGGAAEKLAGACAAGKRQSGHCARHRRRLIH